MTPLGEGGVPADITLTIPLMVIYDIKRLNANHLLTLSVTPRGEMTPKWKGEPYKKRATRMVLVRPGKAGRRQSQKALTTHASVFR